MQSSRILTEFKFHRQANLALHTSEPRVFVSLPYALLIIDIDRHVSKPETNIRTEHKYGTYKT
jgi:hypothetical protein